MSHTTMDIRVSDDLKRQADKIFHEAGISTPDAIRLFLQRVVEYQSVPDGLTMDSQQYDEWLKQKISNSLNDTRDKIPYKF